MTYSDELELYKLTSTTNPWGGTTDTTYTQTGYIKGKVAPVGSNETFINDKMRELADYVVYIPAKLKLNASDRLVYQGRTLQILSTQRQGIAGKRKQQQAICQEVKEH